MSNHVYLGSRGELPLTYHQFYRLLFTKMIAPCAGCTQQADDGTIYYHLSDELHGKTKRLELVLIDLLEENLH